MSSLWTPEGEHRVQPSTAPEPVETASRAKSTAEDDAEDDTALSREVAELERELLEAPVADVVANHCYGLFQLAALHLAQRPPQIEEARLAIDALGALVGALGDRLGDSSATLAQGLANVRLAFVEIAKATETGTESPGGSGD